MPRANIETEFTMIELVGTDWLRRALGSLLILGDSFRETVWWATGETSPSSHACFDDSDGTTQFYLDILSSDHPCDGTDWFILFILFLVIHSISWGIRWIFFEPAISWVVSLRQPSEWSSTVRQKISMNLVAALFFTLSGVFAQRILYHKEWLWTPSSWSTVQMKSVDADLKMYYLLYAARFMSDSVSLFYEHRPREAFWVSCIHHTATLTLVLLSAQYGFTRIGGAIMSFFDWSDPPLLIAKACKYLSSGKRNDGFQFCANRLFELFAIVFVLTRNILYNYVCYVAYRDFRPVTVVIAICFGFLGVLAALQTYWLRLILQAVRLQQQSGGNVNDVRENDPKKTK